MHGLSSRPCFCVSVVCSSARAAMQMKKMTGYPLPLGISVKDDVINFSVAVDSGKTCFLCLYNENSDAPLDRIELTEEHAMGEVRYVALSKSDVDHMEYNYEINGEFILDPYVKSVAEHETITRGKILLEEYDWEGDKPLGLAFHEIIAYNLHVRGFTMHKSSKVKSRGTFAGVIEKIPYLKDLGINQIQCMPIYAFEETSNYKNYWGCKKTYNNSGNEQAPALRSCTKKPRRAGVYCPPKGCFLNSHGSVIRFLQPL